MSVVVEVLYNLNIATYNILKVIVHHGRWRFYDEFFSMHDVETTYIFPMPQIDLASMKEEAKEAEPSITTTQVGAASTSSEIKSDSLDAGDAMPSSPSFQRAQRRFYRRWFPFTAMMLIAVMATPLLYMTAYRAREGSTISNAVIPGRKKGGRDEKVRSIVVVVMPSPPIILGPMSRIDRLMAIRDTWAQDLLSDNLDPGAGAGAGERSTGNHR